MRIARAGRYLWLSAGVALVVLGVATPAAGQAPVPVAVGTVSASKVAIIRRILERTKAIDRVLSGIEAAIPAQRASNPQIPRVFWDELLARARGDTVRLVDLLARAYDSQFSVAELEQLAAFYDSPVGRHLIQAQPTILAQTAQAGQLWGARLSADVMQDLQRRGSQMQQP
jgi:uncharacterized protein